MSDNQNVTIFHGYIHNSQLLHVSGKGRQEGGDTTVDIQTWFSIRETKEEATKIPSFLFGHLHFSRILEASEQASMQASTHLQ